MTNLPCSNLHGVTVDDLSNVVKDVLLSVNNERFATLPYTEIVAFLLKAGGTFDTVARIEGSALHLARFRSLLDTKNFQDGRTSMARMAREGDALGVWNLLVAGALPYV